mmetsp:Transcript_4817/g.8264  ORF Transcript_4817/g.8264 Transcript_4817/m.8264 type:complete len:97 (-) Transcript_4817:149-439(-)
MDSYIFWNRLNMYSSANFGFTAYYQKIYKKEYLPTRVRYNQFFYYLLAMPIFYLIFSKSHSQFAPRASNEDPVKFYTTEKSYVNFVRRALRIRQAE